MFQLIRRCIAVVLLVCFNTSVLAATITVNNLVDSGAGSLRQAISDALAGDTIDFSVTGTINLNTRLVINKNLTITGPGMDQLRISAQNNHRVMHIAAGVVTIEDLTIADGEAQGGHGGDSEFGGGGGGGAGMGAGVFISSGTTVEFARVFFEGNEARGGDGGSSGVTGLGMTGGTGGVAPGGLGFPGGNGGNQGGNGSNGVFAGGGGGGGGAGGSGGNNGLYGDRGGDALPQAGDPSRIFGGGGGGGGALGGAIYSEGALTLTRCKFEKNHAIPGKPGINNFNTRAVELDGGNGVGPDDTRRGSAVYVRTATGTLSIVDEIQFGLNSRTNISGQLLQFPTNPAAFNQEPYEYHPVVAITRSAGPVATTHPQLDNSGHPRLHYIFRNINNSGGQHAGVTVTDLISALAGFRVVDSDTTFTDDPMTNQMGIAITSVDTSNGVWEYDPAGGTAFVEITDVTEANALLLPPDATVRFTGYPEFDTDQSPEPYIEFRAWDGSSNMALHNTFADTSSNGAGTTFSTEIGRVHQPVDVNLKWPAQYFELPYGSQLLPTGFDPSNSGFQILDTDGVTILGYKARALFRPVDVFRAGNPNQNSTIVGVGGVYAVGPVVTSESADITFDATSPPGLAALGVMQMASVAVRTHEGQGSQSINNQPVLLHGPQQVVVVNDTATTEEDAAIIIDVLQNDSDPFSADPVLLDSVRRSFRGVSPSIVGGEIRYTPKPNFHGKDQFFYLAKSTDEQRWMVGMVEVTVTPVNDEPYFTIAANELSNEDAGAVTVSGFVSNFSAGTGLIKDAYDSWISVTEDMMRTEGRPEDVDQNLTFNLSQTSIDPTLSFTVPPVIDPLTGDLTYTAAPDTFGTASYDLFLTDDGATGGNNDNISPTQSFTITVEAQNDAPMIAIGVVDVLEDVGGPVTGLSVSDVDAEDDDLVVTMTVTQGTLFVTSQPGVIDTGSGSAMVTLTGSQTDLNSLLAGNHLSYLPVPDSVVSVTLDVSVNDQGSRGAGGPQDSGITSVTINITAVNDAPSFTPGGSPVSDEDSSAYDQPWATAISAGPADEAGQLLTFNVVNDNNGLFSAQPSVDTTTGNLSFTPTSDANGVANVTVTLMDDGGTANSGVDSSAPVQFTITVTSINDVPSFVVGANQAVTDYAGLVTVPGWATAINPGPAVIPGSEAGQILIFAVTTDNDGQFSQLPAVAADGTLTFEPAIGVGGGLVTVTVTLMDDGGTANGGIDTSAPQQFTIDIAPLTRSFTGPMADGGIGTVSFNTSDVNCTFSTDPAFIPTPAVPAPPEDLIIVNGMVTFAIENCAPGASVTVHLDYPYLLLPFTEFWKVGDPWYTLPSTIVGNRISAVITDGGLGDDDLTMNGTIVDPAGGGFLYNLQPIQTMNQWALILMVLLLTSFAGYQIRRQS